MSFRGKKCLKKGAILNEITSDAETMLGKKFKNCNQIKIFARRMVFLYLMVDHFPMRTYRVNQEFRFIEGIWLHRQSCQIRFFLPRKIPFYNILAQHVLSYKLI